MGGKRGFGQIQKLPSGRHRARYTGPDMILHNAPTTYETRVDAEAWLTDERRLISAGNWTPPKVREAAKHAAPVQMVTFNEYATKWIAERKNKSGKPLAGRTRDHYTSMMESHLTTFAALPLDQITPGVVNLWYDTVKIKPRRKGDTGETAKAHSYGFARSVMNTAVSAHGPLVGQVNPFAIRGGGSSPNTKREELATKAEHDIMLATVRPEWRLLVQLGTWTALRYGEIAELRRGDVNLAKGVLRIRRAVSRSTSLGVHVKRTKSEAGMRDQAIPKFLIPQIRAHLKDHVGSGEDALLFPPPLGSGHLAPSTFYGRAPKYGKGKEAKGKPEERLVSKGTNGWYHARHAASHESLHFHDLRATGATLFAQQGATEAEVQRFLGDSTPQAAQRYVRAARSRMDSLTSKLDDVATSADW
jgi:integrase